MANGPRRSDRGIISDASQSDGARRMRGDVWTTLSRSHPRTVKRARNRRSTVLEMDIAGAASQCYRKSINSRLFYRQMFIFLNFLTIFIAVELQIFFRD